MNSRVNYSGLVIAGLGFFLTRFTVTLAIYEDPLRFYFAGVVPLALGLGLAAFGVALAVADVEASLVRTTAVWCVVGAGTMLVLVVLTLLGSAADGMADVATLRSRSYLSNFLIGGAVGGTLTGLYAARNRRQRIELRQQAHRLEVLNRLLRHEVLNAVTVIKGFASVGGDRTADADEAISEHSAAIEATIEEVKYLARSARTVGTAGEAVDVGTCLADSAASVREGYPEATVSVEHVDDVAVRADERLQRIFDHLLENAVVHAAVEEPSVEVTVTATPAAVRVRVADEGPGLPERERVLLEDGEISDFDDPGRGFGLNVVRLLVENYGGSIETDVGEDGTTIDVILPRVQSGEPGLGPGRDEAAVRPAGADLLVTLGAAVLAGVAYGAVAEGLGGSIAFIGVYYGIENAVVGWLTHEFHSVVFGFVFAGLVSLAPGRYRRRVAAHVAIGIAWAIVLWFVAAGFVSPIWLGLLGIPASIPSLTWPLLVSHLAWGISLGALSAWGYRYVTPWLTRLGDRLGRGPPTTSSAP